MVDSRVAQNKWRNKRKATFWSPAIYRHEWPILIKAMKEGGVTIQVTDRVYFFYGEYQISGTEIRRVWGLSVSQMKKLKDRIISGEWERVDIGEED